MLHLFSAATEQVQYGAEHCQLQSPETSTIVRDLFAEYKVEGLTMPYTMDDYRREVARKIMHELTPEERMAGLPPEERMAGLSLEQIEAFLKRSKTRPATSRKKGPKRGN